MHNTPTRKVRLPLLSSTHCQSPEYNYTRMRVLLYTGANMYHVYSSHTHKVPRVCTLVHFTTHEKMS